MLAKLSLVTPSVEAIVCIRCEDMFFSNNIIIRNVFAFINRAQLTWLKKHKCNYACVAGCRKYGNFRSKSQHKPRQKSATFLNMLMDSVVSLPISCIILEIMIIKDYLSNIAMTLASAVSRIVQELFAIHKTRMETVSIITINVIMRH